MLNIPVSYFESQIDTFESKTGLVSDFEAGQVSTICDIVIKYHNYFSSTYVAKASTIKEFLDNSEFVDTEEEVGGEDEEI
jgi:hypothetical protein